MPSPDDEKHTELTPEPTSPDAHSIAETNSSGNSPDTADALGIYLTAHASQASGPSGHRVASAATTGTLDPRFEVDWDGENDPTHPKNWSMKYRAMAVVFLSWNTLIV